METMALYTERLFVQGLADCAFVYGDQIFSYYLHNFKCPHGKMLAELFSSDITQCIIIIFSLTLSASLDRHKTMLLQWRFYIKCSIRVSAGNQLAFGGCLAIQTSLTMRLPL
jgi:hypothetical protein